MSRWVLTNGEELFVAGSYLRPEVQVRLYQWLIDAVAGDPWLVGEPDHYSNRSARLHWLDDVLVVIDIDDEARTLDVLSIEVLVGPPGFG